MVAPERCAELDTLVQTYHPEFFEAVDRRQFRLEANPIGIILYSSRTLLQVWLLGWVMWKEMYCWSTFIWELSKGQGPFLLTEFSGIPDQDESYANADALHACAMKFADSDPIDWTLWPSDVPRPCGIAQQENEDWLIKDLVQHAIAFFLLHEFRHLMLYQERRKFSDRHGEESECDRWAIDYVLARSDEYAQTSGEDPIKVRSKRAMGVALGTAVMAHVQKGLWEPGTNHPPIAERMGLFASIVDLPGNDFFWNVACTFLLASLRRQEKLPNEVVFRDQRDLFTKLLRPELRAPSRHHESID